VKNNIKISLRNAVPSDIRKIFYLSNDPLVRLNSSVSTVIKWEEHKNLFTKKLKYINHLFLLFHFRDKLIGQVRYIVKNNEAEISISVHKRFRGKKISGKMLSLSQKVIIKEYPNVSKIKATAKDFNEASQKIFLNAGYLFKKSYIINKQKYFDFYLYL
jgi:RimJ/RimL family protein N-acetyltransferase